MVLAASSLSDVLPRVAAEWAARGGGRVEFGFDATSRLAPQIAQGALADLFISADQRWMDWAEERGLIRPGTRTDLLTNDLVVVVPLGRAPVPPDLEALIETPGRLALAGENVPAGRYARRALETAGVWSPVGFRVVRGGSVRSALEWVARGEVEAGVVYRTDAIAEPRVRAVFSLSPGAGDMGLSVVYPAAALTQSARAEEALQFLDFLRGPTAGEIFGNAGFGHLGKDDVSGALAAGDRPRDESPPPGPDVGHAVQLSLVVAVASALLGLLPAVSLGWLLARREFRGKIVVTTAVMTPLVLPPVVTGFLLLTLFGASGFGPWLEVFGLRVSFSLLGAVVAAFVVGFPLYVMAVRGAFESVDHRFEEVALTLGATRARTFRTISLPLALPGIAAGAVLAFARALGEFGATVVLAGNVEGRTRTIALAVYTLLEAPRGQEAIWMLVGASVLLSGGALLGFEFLSRRQHRRLERPRG
jgi:molybdate transport system permease protein